MLQAKSSQNCVRRWSVTFDTEESLYHFASTVLLPEGVKSDEVIHLELDLYDSFRALHFFFLGSAEGHSPTLLDMLLMERMLNQTETSQV
jgi:hypothetical protein